MKILTPVEVVAFSYTELKAQAGFAGTRVVGYTIRWTDIHGNKHIENYGVQGRSIVAMARKEGLVE